MEELESIIETRKYQTSPSYTKKVALSLQPNSFSDFDKHSEFEGVFRLWTQDDRYRGMDVARIWSFILNLKHVASRCPGSVAEVGVYQGQSSALLSYYAAMFHRRMYIADTFEGFAEKQFEADMGEGKRNAFRDVDMDAVRRIIGNYSKNIWIIGLFPDSITQEMRDDSFAFVSIDCDIYLPIVASLDFFWPRLNPGGMIFVHDYSSGYWPGATKAVDEFCAEHHVSGILLPDAGGSYALVKQG